MVIVERQFVDAIYAYQPKLPSTVWEAVSPWVRATVTEQCAGWSPGQARMALIRLARYASWLHITGAGDVADSSLNSGLIDVYWHRRRRIITEHVAKQERKMLRAIAGIAPTIEAGLPSTRSKVRDPYSTAEMAEFRRWAHWLHLPAQRRNVLAMLTLCGGAGLTPAELMNVRYRDILELADGQLGVNVTVRTPRTVPVLSKWNDQLSELADGEPDEWLVAPGSQARDSEGLRNALWAVRGESKPQAGRLRTTWLVGHLTAGTRIDLILEAAGLVDAIALAPLVKHLQREPHEAQLQQLRLGVAA